MFYCVNKMVTDSKSTKLALLCTGKLFVLFHWSFFFSSKTKFQPIILYCLPNKSKSFSMLNDCNKLSRSPSNLFHPQSQMWLFNIINSEAVGKIRNGKMWLPKNKKTNAFCLVSLPWFDAIRACHNNCYIDQLSWFHFL